MTTPSPYQCQALRRDGQPCTAPALAGKPYCWGHDPDYASARDLGRRRGGEGRSNARRMAKAMPPRIGQAFDVLEQALVDTRDGKLEPKTAAAMAAVARAMAVLLLPGKLEERLRQLEEDAIERRNVRAV